MKKQIFEPVIQDWVCLLPFMQQALLMTAMRGPDGVVKYNPAKEIVKYLRGAVLKPAGDITGNEDKFMWIDYTDFNAHTKNFFFDTDAYPMHFLMHLFHAAEVVGYKHSDPDIRQYWYRFYLRACHSLHMNPEEMWQMDKRMDI